MITIKTQREIEGMEKAGQLLASIHEELRDFIKPGITTWDIDQFVEKRTKELGAIPEQIGYEGYQFATCTSVNDEICHGFPEKNRVLKDGDLVGVDTVISLDGFFADSCWSYAVGEVSEEVKDLMAVTKECLYLGIEQAKVGNRIGDIGHAIQSYAESKGYSVVRDFVGHGIQPTMHEDPAVPHYGKPGRGQRLREGMTITIEPMINTGDWKMQMDNNGWTARTIDGGLSCQYEHTLAITKEGPRIFTKQKGE
ncbi:methionine aminopeptidase [Aerococcus urinaehominis]|uniref:Methionine aminopeptidase n=1 Tax=Aerococcus urinaehominis TaxID=128944 RepID=A0A0X8FM12_9LACT|nr:type I methionyl aminopeptidase [Aerococcus urinaehominis]AMB99559.1 methionine aminopeptidase [Aerococcus urinaehominis]SDM35131.1 methionyl aminopeptidase [Aerococcus urinaehominis]